MSTGGWIHIPDKQEPLPPAEPKRRGGRGKLTTAQRTEILQRWRGGEKQTALAKEYGVSVSAISLIVKKAPGPQEAQSEQERPRKAQKALTPAWLRERAVQRARELQNDVAMQNKRIEEAQREKEKAEKALHELRAWLEEN